MFSLASATVLLIDEEHKPKPREWQTITGYKPASQYQSNPQSLAAEGVYGMRRAAAIAGVRTFVAPLWKIADATEQTLMGRFYKELSAGKGRAEALRQAQLQLLGNPRAASFLQWAPVILSGDPAPLPQELFVK